MAKPKLKNKKQVIVPKGTESVVITFRTVKRKGKIKGATKTTIPRTAQQVVVEMKKVKKKTSKK